MINDAFEIYRLVSRSDVKLDYFLYRIRFAFLPRLVYELEEYGLPRMISKKIQATGLVDLMNESLSLNELLDQFRAVNEEKIISLGQFDDFDKYFIHYFYQGISTNIKGK